MHILIFNWRDTKHEWAGGGEVYVSELAKRWVKMRHRVSLFVGQNVAEKLADTETIDGVTIYRKGGRFTVYFWAFWYYVRKFRKKIHFIVDVQNGIPFFTRLYSRKPKVAVVYHIHGKPFFLELTFPLSIVGYIIERYIFPLIYRGVQIISISKTTKKELEKIGINGKNIEIIHPGINIGTLEKAKTLSRKFSRPTILYLGRIKKYKRVDLLMQVMPEILKEIPQARLFVAGWGTEASAITDMSMRSKLRKKLKIIGPVSTAEKKELLSRSWVFVNPSMHEGWGISVIEANLHGTPAVAFRVPGLLESIKDQETGYLVHDKEELVEKIVLLLKHHAVRKKLSLQAKKWAKSFSWENAAESGINLLKKVRRKRYVRKLGQKSLRFPFAIYGKEYAMHPEILLNSFGQMSDDYKTSSKKNKTSGLLSILQKLYIRLFGIPEIGFQLRSLYFHHCMEKLRKLEPKHILDAGSGIGLYTLHLSREFPNAIVTGVDLDNKKIFFCKRFAKELGVENAVFKKSDIVENFSNGVKYDLIVNIDVLEHIGSYKAVLRNFYKLLSPKGYLYIHTPQPDQRRIFKQLETWHHEDHIHEGFPPQTLTKDLQTIGFKVIEKRQTFGFFGSLAWELNHLLLSKSLVLSGIFFPLLYLLANLDLVVNNKRGLGTAVVAQKAN